MTHLAGVADRIDRSYSPRGEGEERELDVLFQFVNERFKERCGQLPHTHVYSTKRGAKPWIPSRRTPFPFRAWIRGYIFPARFQ